MDNLKVKIFAFLIFVAILATMLVFRFFIDKQKQLDFKELEQIVEKEIQEKHGKF